MRKELMSLALLSVSLLSACSNQNVVGKPGDKPVNVSEKNQQQSTEQTKQLSYQMQKMEKENGRFQAEYPFLDLEKFDQQISDFLQDQELEFQDFSQDNPSDNSTMTISVQRSDFDKQITSWVFEIDSYYGGAHPNSTFKTFTFDSTRNKFLTFDEIFQAEHNPIWTLEPLIKAQLQSQLSEMGFADGEMLNSGLGEDPNNYQNFAFGADEMTFYFPAYQVAPYAAGSQKISLKLSELATILQEPFLQLQ